MEIKNTPTITFPKNNETAPADSIKVQVKTETGKHQAETQSKVTKEMLETRVESMNDFLQPTTTAVKFQLHEKLNEYYIQVVNPVTEEVLKEIPNKKFLDMHAPMMEFLGLIVDEKS